jgi:hypothetical protein
MNLSFFCPFFAASATTGCPAPSTRHMASKRAAGVRKDSLLCLPCGSQPDPSLFLTSLCPVNVLLVMATPARTPLGTPVRQHAKFAFAPPPPHQQFHAAIPPRLRHFHFAASLFSTRGANTALYVRQRSAASLLYEASSRDPRRSQKLRYVESLPPGRTAYTIITDSACHTEFLEFMSSDDPRTPSTRNLQ